MKILTLILTLSLASFSFAKEENHDADEHTPRSAETVSPACAVDKDPTKCEIHAGGGHKVHGKNKDWTHERLEQVAKVLPQPVQDKTKSERPEAVTLTSPKFLTTVSGTDVKLEWSKSNNAKVYHLQVSKDAGFNNRSMYVLNNNSISETSFDVKNLEPNTKYFWRVAAVNSDMKDSFTKSNFTSSVFTTK